MSDARTILLAIHERFKTLEGIKALLDYEPAVIEATPLIYSLLDESHRTQQQSLTTRRYRFLHRLVVQWVDNQSAEQTILRYTNLIPNAIDANPQLAGTITSGIAVINDQVTGFVTINKVLYRVLDSYSDVTIKGRFQSGI